MHVWQRDSGHCNNVLHCLASVWKILVALKQIQIMWMMYWQRKNFVARFLFVLFREFQSQSVVKSCLIKPVVAYSKSATASMILNLLLICWIVCRLNTSTTLFSGFSTLCNEIFLFQVPLCSCSICLIQFYIQFYKSVEIILHVMEGMFYDAS